IVIGGYVVDASTARRFVAAVARHAPCVVYGFTSMLVQVARLALDLGLAVPRGAIIAAWNGGELLTAKDSELFARAFGVPIHDLYGGRELSTIACQYTVGGALEVVGPHVMVEIVDDAGE